MHELGMSLRPIHPICMFHCGKALPRNPDFPTNEKLWVYKAFAGMRDIKKKSIHTEACLTKQATIDEEDWFGAV